MTSEDVEKSFIEIFVIGFGFLSGLWIHVGVNPETEIIKAFSSIIKTLNASFGFSFLFWIIPIIVLVGSIIGSLVVGGWLGLIAVGFAFLGGIFINSTFGIICLFIGIVLGFIAPNVNNTTFSI